MNIKVLFFFSLAALFNTLSFAQVTNDDCNGAIDLGTLTAPAPCPDTTGTTQTFNLDNTGATAEIPYTYLIGCQPSGDMAAPAADVWYTFTASTNIIDVNITGGLNDPSVGLYEGPDCSNLIGRGCANGSGGSLSATFQPLTPGNTYYFQISGGNVSDQGSFTMTITSYNDCDPCLLTASITSNPPPNGGFYNSGDTISFCFTVTEWSQTAANWIHAVIPTFGPGWDLSTLVVYPPATCDNSGSWDWYNSVTSYNTGITYGPGFYYESIATCFFCVSDPTDPGDNYGDNCQGSVNWPFCWDIAVATCPPNVLGTSLSISIDTYGDAETGSWDNLGCELDPIYNFFASAVCCTDPLASVDQNVSCYGGNDGQATATGQGMPPFIYRWDTSPEQNTTTATGLSAGTYTVTVTDSVGCVNPISVTITEPSAIIITFASTPASCGGSDGTATVSASGGTGVYTYAWSPIGGIDSTASNLPAGTYSVIVTDGNGCTQTDSIVVANTGGPAVSIASFTNVSCSGGSDGTATVSVTGGTPPYTYLWTNGDITSIADSLFAGNYAVTVMDSNGCIGSDNITITEPTPLIATGNSSPSNCNNSNGLAFVNPLGGIPPYTYLWNDPDSQITDTATGLSAGAYIVIITDDNGCTLAFPVSVSNISGPIIDSITTTDVTCNGESTGSATVSISSGTLPFAYLWDDSLAQTTITATGLAAGLVSVTVTDLNNCIVIGSINIAEPSPLIVNTFGANICYGDSVQISAAALGGTGAHSYTWDNSLPDSTAHIVSPDTTTTYTVIVMDENSCQDSATITVIVYPPLMVSGSSVVICEGESVVLSAAPSGGNGGPYYYTWNDGSTDSSITVSPLDTITYTVIVSDSCSPDDTATVNIFVNPLPSVSFNAACFPDPFITQFTNNSSPISGSAFLWDFGDGSPPVGGQNPSHVYSSSGDYTVNLTVTTDKGCSNDTAIIVQSPPTAEFILTPNETTTANPEINFTDFSNTFSNVAYWEWDFGDGYSIDNFSGQAGSDFIPFDSNLTTGTYQDPSHTYSDAGTYYILLTVYNADGCRDTAMQFVKIFSEYFLFAPSAFTPNGNKINDVFMPQGVGINEGNFEMSIFNRWGDLIYETNDFNKGWDGKANKGRKIAQTGVYIWLIKTKDPRGSRHHYIGRVTLIR